ncbi:MAG: family 43 glycosylhydrolase [Paludibacter sp.]|nr:family 43 glycosylhydrolase [Paludibacter sp.]
MKRGPILFIFLYFISFVSMKAEIPADGLQLHYSFETVSGSVVSDASGNGYNGTLEGGAAVETEGNFNVLRLGTDNGYLDMGTNTGNLIATLSDFTVATYLYISPDVTITENGNFAWTFSTSAACSQTAGKYIAYRVNTQRYAQTTAGWGSENALTVGTAADKGVWHHVVYTQSGTTGTIYIDGQVAKIGTISLQPKNIGSATSYNWLGRPQFSSDSYLKGASYTDFRIYNRALTATEINSFVDTLSDLNYVADSAAVEQAKTDLAISGLDAVKYNLALPATTGDDVNISWSSSNTAYLTSDGKIIRPALGEDTASVTLTATLSKGDYSVTKDFTVTILPEITDQEAVESDADDIDINAGKCYYLGQIKLPLEGDEGSTITWKSAESDYLTNSGTVVKLPAKGEGTKTVVLTATISRADASVTKDYNICINEDEGYAGYLWVYFTGNTAYTQENIFFALSSDGYNYKTLNSGNYVIKADTISNMNGVRDPHIMRGADGKYYMVATDMRASLGWSSNHGIVLMKSDDMIHWSHSAIDIQAKYSNFSNITRAWAPETFYDEETGKYMIYFSMRTSDSNSYDIIYYAYANDDFTDLATEPKILFDNGVSTIDGCIVKRDGKYNLFFKTEDAADKGYKKAVSDQLTEGYVLQDKYLDQSDDAVEGACVFKLNNQEKYILMYDLYTTGKYEFTVSDSLDNFRTVTAGVSRDFAPRHGTIMGITQEEAQRLAEKWGSSSMVTFGTALSPQVKPINIEVDETNGTVFIPVEYGTDLTSFDPQITSPVAGVSVTPQGAQDFSHGAVSYTLSLNDTDKTYSVTAAVDNNPAIEGYYADPEVLYSEKTGKFYIYPTSDGFASWGGYYFKVFSSDDLVNWADEGVIIDMHDTGQITWANGNAWAPCIIEKKINGKYKYVFYFSGGKDGGSKKLGYAVADNPTGPFTVSSEPLISSSPTGSGQQIDSDVFTDPGSGKTYLYWGNGYMAVAELNDNLTSLKTTPSVITPSSNYTEGTYVFYRDGKYYFTWSYGNTGNADYCVYYGYSTSPTGSITIPSNNKILSKNTTLGINGPGHNSIIQIPGKDEWYIVYHRISRPNGINSTSPSPGNVRELCIDKLEFNEDGTIKSVVPTLEGISPVNLGGNVSSVTQTSKDSDNGNLQNIEVYNISGIKISYKNQLPVGVYILKKTYENGHVVFEKVLLSQNMNSLRQYNSLLQ